MKKSFKSTIKCLLMSICLAGVGAFMFASNAYATGTIESHEESIYGGYHESRGYTSSDTISEIGLKYADHDTSEWQELGYTGGLGDYGVSWSTDGTNFGHDDLYVGQTVTFRFNMHSENVGNHYANILKGWIDWNTSDTTYKFDESDSVVEGFKVLRDYNGDLVSSDYTFDSGHDNPWESDYGDKYYNRDDYGYGNDNETFTYSLTLTEANLGTAYLRARVTCSDSINQNLGRDWSSQWNYTEDQYLAAFDAYSDYYQGEIEDWMFTVSGNPPGSAVPEPTTLALFGMGLIGLARVGRKKA